jgi:hypothetical protein
MLAMPRKGGWSSGEFDTSFRGGGVLILQYADDTIIFMQHDFDKALNMKLGLYIFE